jgi:hypothetical protein
VNGRELACHPLDYALIPFFAISVLYGALFSLPEGLGLPVAPDSPWPPLRALHGWAVAQGLLYAGAGVTNMWFYFFETLSGPLPPPHLSVYLPFNLPWLVAPAVLGWRLWPRWKVALGAG